GAAFAAIPGECSPALRERLARQLLVQLVADSPQAGEHFGSCFSHQFRRVVEDPAGRTDTKSSSFTSRRSPGGSVTRAWVRPEAATNSTATASGPCTSTTAPRSPCRRPCAGRSRVRTTTSRVCKVIGYHLGKRSQSAA